ncbi:MAG: hypothetical protein OXC96_06265 [Cyanobacteria bacterium MAG CAR1_bin_15]|nr:hypothetical protein [Cyanobacteria bacterium MAG CAR1_bin_15]
MKISIAGAANGAPAPTLENIEYETPGSSPANGDTLKWRATFSEAVDGMDAADFSISGTDARLSVTA